MENDDTDSKCGEDSQEWDSFDQTVADVPAPELNNMIDEAVAAVRKDESGQRSGK